MNPDSTNYKWKLYECNKKRKMEARLRALEDDVLRLKKTVTWQRFELERIRRAAGVSEPQTREERAGGTKVAPPAKNTTPSVMRKPRVVPVVDEDANGTPK